MVAAIVCSLGFAWGPAARSPATATRSQQHPLRLPWFYGGYLLVVAGAALIVALWPNLVALSIGVQVMNALMLPAVLGTSGTGDEGIAARTSPEGAYLWLVQAVLLSAAQSLYLSAISGLGLLD